MQWEGDLWAKTRWTRAPRAWGGQGATFRPLGRKGGWRWEQAGLRDRSVGRGGARARVGAETEDCWGRKEPGLRAAGDTKGAQDREQGAR